MSSEVSLVIGLFIEVSLTDMTRVGLFASVSPRVSFQTPARRERFATVHTTKLPLASWSTHSTAYICAKLPSLAPHIPYFEVTLSSISTSSANWTPMATSAHVLAPPTARRPPAHALKRHQNLGQCSRLVWEGLCLFRFNKVAEPGLIFSLHHS